MTLIVLTLIGIAAMYIFSENAETVNLSETQVMDLVEAIRSSGTMAEAISHYNGKGSFQDDRISDAFNDKMAEFTPKLCFS